MPDIGLNQPVTVAASFYNDAGPITGASVITTITSRRTGTTLVSAQPATESPAGSGYYTYTISASLLTQSDRLRIVFSSAGSGLYNETFARVGDTQDWMLNRREVRQGIARRLDGWNAAWEMDASSGSTTTAVLPSLNFGGENEFAGMWARFSDGANRGLDRRVLEYDDETLTITFGPALPQAVASGDRVELYRIPAYELDRVIRRAFADADRFATYEIEERILATDGATFNFDLPSDIRTINSVGLYDSQRQEFMGWLMNNRWELGPGGKLTIMPNLSYNREQDPLAFGPSSTYQPLPSGYGIWLRGTAAVGPPLYDDSYCDLPPSYLEASGHYQLALTRPDMSAVWAFLRQERDAELKRAIRAWAANSREVSP